jgi:hypothetical protein
MAQQVRLLLSGRSRDDLCAEIGRAISSGSVVTVTLAYSTSQGTVQLTFKPSALSARTAGHMTITASNVRKDNGAVQCTAIRMRTERGSTFFSFLQTT